VSTARRLRFTLGLVALVAACGDSGESVTANRIGEYSLDQQVAALEIRSIPDQHPNLNRLLASIHPSLAKVGLPSVTVSRTEIVERGSLGNETEWPRSALARITVQSRLPRGMEAKTQSLDRTWRVSLLRADGQPLRSSFGFGSESDARAFAAALGSALGAQPQDEGPNPTHDGG
jgi:hypothetical protein